MKVNQAEILVRVSENLCIRAEVCIQEGVGHVKRTVKEKAKKNLSIITNGDTIKNLRNNKKNQRAYKHYFYASK